MRTVEPRLYALPGKPLLVPLAIPPGRAAEAARALTWAAGRPIDGVLWRVGLMRERAVERSRLSGWLESGAGGTGNQWGASEAADAETHLPVGAWVLLARVGEGERPVTLQLEDSVTPLVWLDASPEVGRALLRSVASAEWAGGDPAVLRLFLEGAEASPLSRWRADLVLDAVGGTRAEVAAPGEVREDSEREDVIDLLAKQVAWRWDVGFTRLAGADRAVATAVAQRLLGGLRFEFPRPGLTVPAWPAESAELDRLLDSLLDPRATREDLLQVARSWLDVQSRGEAWIVDDSGLTDAISGEVIATVAMANLTSSKVVCWARREDAGAAGRLAEDLDTAPARTVLAGTALCGQLKESAGNAGAGVVLAARIGAVQQRLGVLSSGIAVRPPGFSIGPFSADWTDSALLTPRVGGGPAVPSTAAAPTAARLLRARSDTGGESWTLFLECSDAPGEGPRAAGESAPSAVRVWIGPFGHPTAVWRIDSSGEFREQAGAAREQPMTAAPRGEPTRQMSVVRDGSRWRVFIPIPSSLIDERGILRLGLERLDASARRSAWPRAMLPWQVEPGRAALDTSAW